ncbi:MAG: VanZ family protein [Candidatus Omnitrophota bacterium]
MSARRLWWALFGVYALLNYSTLGLMPSVWNTVNRSLGGRGLLLQYTIYSLFGIGILFYVLFIKREESILKYLLLLFFAGIFFIMVEFEKNPGEKIHMAQYGLSGLILYNALKVDLDRFKMKLYAIGSAICLLTGAVDEIIQWFLPNRVFTWHDVFINGASGIIVLLAIRFNILSRLRPSPTAADEGEVSA